MELINEIRGLYSLPPKVFIIIIAFATIREGMQAHGGRPRTNRGTADRSGEEDGKRSEPAHCFTVQR